MSSTEVKIPQANRALPILNHALAFSRNPIEFFLRQSRQMGPIYAFQLFQREIVVANSPEAVQAILVGEVQYFSRRKTYAFLRALLGNGLITAEGDGWRKRRRMLQPGFKREQLEGLIDGIQTTVSGWCEHRRQQAEEVVDLHEVMNELTLKVLTRSIVETEWSGELADFQLHLSTAWNFLTDQRFQSSEKPTGNQLILGRFKKRRAAAGQAAIAQLKSTASDIIAKRRASGKEASDLLAMLLSVRDSELGDGLSDEELLDEVMTLVIAGHDTTASALTWTFHCLAKHPEWIERIRQEARELSDGAWSMADLQTLDVTKRVIQEAMRLYPPVWTFGRRTTEPMELCGYYIPADCSVTMPLSALHRQADQWERPDDFFPDHFLPEAVKMRHKLAYFPFGAGQRMCIGSHYAMMEMQLIVAQVLAAFTPKLPPLRRLRLLPQVTLQPAQPLPCVFEPFKL